MERRSGSSPSAWIAREPVVNTELSGASGRQPATQRERAAQWARPSRVCKCVRRGGLALRVSSRPVNRRRWAMSKLARMVAAGLAVASLLLGAAASASRRRLAPMVFVALLGTLLALGCAPERPPRPPSGDVIVAAGDIADCRTEGDEATAKLVGGIDGSTVLTLGDNAYPEGSAEDFEECYDPAWGRFKDRTKPIPGNHEYDTQGAAGYFDYFGKAAGDPEEGYYSYDLGRWHIIALNSKDRKSTRLNSSHANISYAVF